MASSATICAVCRVFDGVVVTIIVASSEEEAPISDCILVQVPDGHACKIGDSWDGQNFVSKNPEYVIPDENGEV